MPAPTRREPRTQDNVAEEIVHLLRTLPPNERGGAGNQVSPERRTALRRLGELMVELRQFFATDDGPVSGNSYPYRQLSRELYQRAGIEPEEARAIQAAVRYHAGNVLRENLDHAQLDELGLSELGPIERSRLSKARLMAIVAAVVEDAADPDLLRTVASSLALVSGVDVRRLQALTGDDRERARTLLTNIAERATGLAAKLG